MLLQFEVCIRPRLRLVQASNFLGCYQKLLTIRTKLGGTTIITSGIKLPGHIARLHVVDTNDLFGDSRKDIYQPFPIGANRRAPTAPNFRPHQTCGETFTPDTSE
jgi:hypothetical protein